MDYVGKDLLQMNQRTQTCTVLHHGVHLAIASQLYVGSVYRGEVAYQIDRDLLLFHLMQSGGGRNLMNYLLYIVVCGEKNANNVLLCSSFYKNSDDMRLALGVVYI